MGNSQQKHHTINLVDLSQWKQMAIHRETSKIVQHQTSNLSAQLQLIPFNPKHNLEKELDIYQYRKTQSAALVKCLGVVCQKQKSSSICGSNHVLKVLTQRIPTRLNQLPQLSFPESLYVLSQSLRGYKDCYSKLGPFYVDDEMIGFNLEGETKVWVNQNFAENHPLIEKPSLQTSGSQIEQSIEESMLKSSEQTDMVDNILKVVEKKCEHGHFPAQFRQRVYQTPLTFDQTFKEIEQFVKFKGIFVPDRIASQVSQEKKRLTLQTVTNQNINLAQQRASFLLPTADVSKRLFTQTQQTPHRLSSPNPFSPTQQRTHSPIKILFQRPSVTVLSPRSPNHINEVRSTPIPTKITFRFLSPQKSTPTFNKRNTLPQTHF